MYCPSYIVMCSKLPVKLVGHLMIVRHAYPRQSMMSQVDRKLSIEVIDAAGGSQLPHTGRESSALQLALVLEFVLEFLVWTCCHLPTSANKYFKYQLL